MIKLFNGDCIIEMQNIKDKSINLILTDLPYGETRSKWDKILDFEKMWEQYLRIITDNGAIVLFGNEPFSSMLRQSQPKYYRYDWKWVKNRATGFANCNYRPMRTYEDIMVFSKANASAGGKSNPMIYNPQGLVEVNKTKKNTSKRKGLITYNNNNLGESNSLNGDSEYVQKYTNYPSNVLYFDCEKKYIHPTQKPLELVKYLVETYSNAGDIVLDSCMGSGTTGVACKELERDFYGIEIDENYFNIAEERIKEN